MSSGTIVLGMHRSGTSLVAEILHRAGLFGRERECLPANQWNEHGYWELSDLVAFNERLLHEVDSDWILPPGPRQAQRLAELADRADYRRQATDLLRLMSGGERNSAWFWKDPRLSMVLPFWQKIWGDVRYVICARNPIEVSDSLARRDGFSASFSLRLWQSYTVSILNQTLERPRLFVQYERILADPARECLRLAEFLEISRPLTAALPAMQRAVNGKLHHSSISSTYPEAEKLNAAQLDLFKTLQRMARNSPNEDLRSQDYCLPKCWRASLRKDILWMRCRKRYERVLKLMPEAQGCPFGSGCMKGTASSGYEIY